MSATPTTLTVDAVLFDVDGTLIDTKSLYITAYRRAVEPFLREGLTEDDVKALKPTSEIAFVRQVVAEADFDACLDGFYRVYQELHDEECRGIFPGVLELLETLRRAGLPIGLVTGKSRRSWEITRRAIGSLGRFDTLICDDDVRAPKPDPHGLEMAVEALGIEPSRAAYVGDTMSDMEAARAAGLHPVAALWAFDEARRARHLDRVRAVDALPLDLPGALPDLIGLS